MSANEVQVGGTHYRSAYQHWDFVIDADLNYFTGQITKYISRWRKKNGTQDLEKAQHFARKYAECLEVVRVPERPRSRWLRQAAAVGFCKENDLGPAETHIIMLCAGLQELTTGTMQEVCTLIDGLLAAEPGRGYVAQD